MGIEDRKQRHKEDLKATILRAAKELFLEKGFERTSMRNIAEK
ncbi:MAG TPA: TetR family transcriptional regulator, partial [Cyclobacteriaceae bacterium]|nr:TetR family transcriptional regulator [Cyclobacteriaceae bacterium]